MIRRHFRWNYAIIAIVEGVWCVGAAMCSYVTILPVFMERLGASPLLIGLLPATFHLFFAVPQLLAARLTGHLPLKKYVFTLVHYPGCLSLSGLGVLVVIYGDRFPASVIPATFVWVVLYGLTLSFAMPMWVNMMAKLFPSDLRGKSFGIVFLLGGLLGAGGAWVAARVLSALAFPRNFGVLFIAGGLLMSGCISAFPWLREPVRPPRETTGCSGFSSAPDNASSSACQRVSILKA